MELKICQCDRELPGVLLKTSNVAFPNFIENHLNCPGPFGNY